MIETQPTLDRMSAAEGGSAAHGLALLLKKLMEAGILSEGVVSEIRDAMLLGIDPSIMPADDRAMQLAYKNTLAGFSFLSTEPRELFEPHSEGALALGHLLSDWRNR